MAYTISPLPYAFDALEPHIDALTMEIHHDRHHATYASNLTAAIDKHPDLVGTAVEELLADLNAIPEDIRTAVRNNGGGHANHELFWKILSPQGGGNPGGGLGPAITAKWGSFDEFKKVFTAASVGQFGSGWGWLVLDGQGELDVYGTPNQDSPLSRSHTPLLGCDVWEHAYYLNYQNARAKYVEAFWNVVNWAEVEARYAAATA